MKTINSPEFSVVDEIPDSACDIKKNETATRQALTPAFFQTLKLEGTVIIESEDDFEYPVHTSQCMKINRKNRYEY